VKFKLILRALWQMWRTVVYWPNFNQCDVTPGTKCPNFGEITRNNGHYVVQGHSRSPLPKNTGYNLRKRTHNLTLPTDISAVIKQNFVYIECCSETSINLVFMSHCYFASIFYSIADVFYIINVIFFVTFILCRMCVCHMFNKVLTYLLTYVGTNGKPVYDFLRLT